MEETEVMRLRAKIVELERSTGQLALFNAHAMGIAQAVLKDVLSSSDFKDQIEEAVRVCVLEVVRDLDCECLVEEALNETLSNGRITFKGGY